jgi:DNA-binding GntR family transcriptional regulator
VNDEVSHVSPTRGDRLRRALEDEILGGRLSPGTRLDETALAEQFGVSRTPVREALKQLASAGLIEIRPRQGAFVVELTMAEIFEIFELMAELEALCAGLAARRMSQEERARLIEAHRACERIAREEEPEAFYAANNAFHEIVYRGSHNRFVERETRALRNRIHPYRRFITYRPGRLARSIAEHAAILEAIVAGAEEPARRAMHQHLSVLAEDMLEINRALERRRAATARS